MRKDTGGLINIQEEGAPVYVSAGMNTDVFDGSVVLVDAEHFFTVAEEHFVIEDGFGTPESDVLRKHLYDKQCAVGGIIAPSVAVIQDFGLNGEEPVLRNATSSDDAGKIRLSNGGELAYLKDKGVDTIPVVISLNDQDTFWRLFEALDADDSVSLEKRLSEAEGGFSTTVTDLAARTYTQAIREYEEFQRDFSEQRQLLERSLADGDYSKERFDWEAGRMDELYVNQASKFGAFPEIHSHIMVLAAAGVEQVRIPDYFDSDQILEAVATQADAVRDDLHLNEIEPLELVSRYERMLALNPQDSLNRTAILMLDGDVDTTRQRLRGELVEAIKADDEALDLARDVLSNDQLARLDADMSDAPGPLFNPQAG